MRENNETIYDHKKVKTLTNYVLVKVDEDFTKYHLNGKETDIEVGISAMKETNPLGFDDEWKETVQNYSDHWASTGTVISSPSRLVYYGDEIKKINEIRGNSIDESDFKQINSMRMASVDIYCGLEVSDGDRIIFDYTERMNAPVIKTDIGDLLLIHYKNIIGIFKEDNYLHPVNGNIFVEWIKED